VPYFLIRRRLTPRTIRLADLLCIGIIAAGAITACGSANSNTASPPTTRTFTSSAVVTLTIH
jgi:hypothetical protein